MNKSSSSKKEDFLLILFKQIYMHDNFFNVIN